MSAQNPIPFFEALYEATYNQTLLTVTRGCGDPGQIPDIMQDIYADVYATILTRGTAYLTNPAGFVQHIAKHKLYEWYGLRARLRLMTPLQTLDPEGQEYDLPELATEPPAAMTAEERLMVQHVAGRLRRYPPDVQKIFICRFQLDMTLAQIAKALGMGESNVKAKLYRTLNELRKYYQKEGADL